MYHFSRFRAPTDSVRNSDWLAGLGEGDGRETPGQGLLLFAASKMRIIGVH
jgi:hypothetical protein